MIDFSTELGRYATDRLGRDIVVWLTTIGKRSGDPLPSLVWFWWNGTDVLVPSQPGKPKLHNIAAHTRVALNFDSEYGGDGVVVFSGTAAIASAYMNDDEWSGFAAKYAERFPNIDLNAEEFRGSFSELIRISLDRLRGFADVPYPR
ncbi:pyridoxamine 5'-phosphate oxidase family protein [Flindersiella endophytica]